MRIKCRIIEVGEIYGTDIDMQIRRTILYLFDIAKECKIVDENYEDKSESLVHYIQELL